MPITYRFGPLTIDTAWRWIAGDPRFFAVSQPVLRRFLREMDDNYSRIPEELPRFKENFQRFLAPPPPGGAEHIRAQKNLAMGINELGDNIVRRFPPDRYAYLGIGRSPAALIADLQRRGCDAINVPLSRFHWRNRTSSITDAAVDHGIRPRAPRLDPQLDRLLHVHFEEMLRAWRMGERNILVLDFTVSAVSLISAAEQIQRFMVRQASRAEVHALAICKGRDYPNQLLRQMERSAEARCFPGKKRVAVADFLRRFHLLELVTPPILFDLRPDQASVPKELVQAFDDASFDDWAEYGSFDIRGRHARDYVRPERREAFDVLREALCVDPSGDEGGGYGEAKSEFPPQRASSWRDEGGGGGYGEAKPGV